MIKKISQNKFILSLLAGALCALSFAPFHFFIAAIISVSVFWFLLEKKCNSTKEAAWLGMCYGFGYFVAGIYWVAISMLVDAAKFAWLIPFSLTLLPGFLALYSAGLAACYKKINQKFLLKNNYQKILLFALLWLVAEVLRSFIFTGFPWNLLGYSLMFNDAVMQSAAFIGVYGLSFFAVLFCLTPILLYNGLQNSNHDKIFAAILAILFAVNFIYGYQHLQNSKIVEHKETTLSSRQY
jgi:apolipoprotein N-acyltransferase